MNCVFLIMEEEKDFFIQMETVFRLIFCDGGNLTAEHLPELRGCKNYF